MTPAKIIVIDDNEAVLHSLRLVLKREFATVVAVGDPHLIPALVRDDDVDVVLLDMNFGKGRLDGRDGLFWLERIKQRSSLACPPAVVLITAFGDVELAVESLKRGADDFIQKPWDNDRLIAVLREAVEKHRRAADSGRTSCRQAPADSVVAAAGVGRQEETASLGRAHDGGERDAAPAATLDELERQHIEQVLAACGHNMQAAAGRLGISRQTLYNKMKRHGID